MHALPLADRAAESRVRLQPLIAQLAASSTMSVALMELAGAVEVPRCLDRIAARERTMTPAAHGPSRAKRPTGAQPLPLPRLLDNTTVLTLLRGARRVGLGFEPWAHAEPAFAVLRR